VGLELERACQVRRAAGHARRRDGRHAGVPFRLRLVRRARARRYGEPPPRGRAACPRT
jgi:hypothetical protein